jgi:hypothetical protein
MPPATHPMRGTQSFVQTMARCWRRPSLLALELAWRWTLGIPALLVLLRAGWRIYNSVPLEPTGIGHFSLLDPVTAAQILSAVVDTLLPPVRAVAVWFLPVFAVAWAVASGVGRVAVLRRYDARLHSAPLRVAVLQMLRVLALGGSIALWWICLRHVAQASLGGAQPNLIGYFAKAIFLSLGIFVVWAVGSWIFSIAPLLVLLEDKSALAALGLAMGPSSWLGAAYGQERLRGLRSRLVEINLVMGIVKLCLVVLAMVLSAVLLPFQDELTPAMFYSWWIFISILYLAASDFFQIVRLAAFLDLWRAVREA